MSSLATSSKVLFETAYLKSGALQLVCILDTNPLEHGAEALVIWALCLTRFGDVEVHAGRSPPVPPQRGNRSFLFVPKR